MSITAANADFDAATIGGTVETPPTSGLFIITLQIPTNIVDGDLLVLGIAERDGGAGSVPTAIDGNISGSWNIAAAPTGTLISSSTGAGGGYSALHFKVYSGAGGTDTITVTFSAVKQVRLAVGRCPVTGTAPTLDDFDSTPASGNTANPTSGSITPGGDGLAIGFLALGGDEDITGVGSGETDVTNEAMGVHFLSEPAVNGVAMNFGALTLTGSRDTAFHIAAFIQEEEVSEDKPFFAQLGSQRFGY